MATLEEVRAALLPAARWASAGADADGAAAARDVGWVRVMKARVPAFDALEAGDVAIVPASALAVVAPGQPEVDGVVEACSRAAIAGILLVDADDEGSDAARRAMDWLDAAAARGGVPLLRTSHVDPATLERSVIGFLVNRRAELEHQAAVLETQLEALAIEGGGIDRLVAAVAGFLGRAVALEGRRGEAIAVHAPPGPVDSGAAVAAYHARRRFAALRVPLPSASGPAGSLALLGDRPPSELERVVAARVAGLLALELARDDAMRQARDVSRRAETLPGDGPPWVVIVARQRLPDDAADGASRERARRDVRALAPARRMSLRGDADSLEIRAVVAVAAGDPDGTGIAGRIAASLGRTVAVSRPFGDPVDRPAAEAGARTTLEAAETLDDVPAVVRADRLPAYRLLANLGNVPDGRRLARALLEPLLSGRADVRREHLATLRAVLDHPGLAEAAAALGVHRNTVAYRVRRIEAVTGWQIADPELRLPLAVALRLVQTEQDGR
ncbi:MAG: PucR family transcriptional regulator [Chloroflexota bacterium]